MRVFLDTNILLDVIGRRKAHFDASMQLWTLAEQGQMIGLVAAISFTNIYYVVQTLTNRSKAEKTLCGLRDIFTIIPCTEQIINQAIDAGFRDFEDAVQYFSALHARAEYIVTRNTRHFPNDSPPTMTPAEFLASHAFDEITP